MPGRALLHALMFLTAIFVVGTEVMAQESEKDSRDVVEAFVRAITRGKLEEAGTLCWPERRGPLRLPRLRVASGGAELGIRTVDATREIALAVTNPFKYRPVDGPRVEARFALEIRKREGQWLIHTIDIDTEAEDSGQAARARFLRQFPAAREIKPRILPVG